MSDDEDTPGARFCRACEVSSREATCWLCGEPLTETALHPERPMGTR